MDEGPEKYWDVLPWWVRTLTYMIGLPALLVSLSPIFVQPPPPEAAQNVAFGIWGIIVLIQLIFIARAYWRMDF
jgi:hypothetical protein